MIFHINFHMNFPDLDYALAALPNFTSPGTRILFSRPVQARHGSTTVLAYSPLDRSLSHLAHVIYALCYEAD